MKKKQRLLATAIAGAMAMGASAATTNLIEQWTFDAPDTQMGTNGTIVSTWTTNAPNSVVTAGVLQYKTTGNSNWGNGNLLPDIDTSTIEAMTWTIEVADLYIAAGDNFRFSSIVSGGTGGFSELQLTSWGTAGVSDTFAPDMEYNRSGSDDLDVTVASLNGNPLGGALTDCQVSRFFGYLRNHLGGR